MSDEVKATATWNGVKVDTYTNVRTGEIRIYQTKQLTPVLLAKSTPGNGKAGWTYVGNSGYDFMNIYNNEQRATGGKELTQKEFNQQFFTTGTKAFNNIRGTILRTEANYVNAGIPITERELIKQGHFNNRVPGSVDPASDIMVNSDGTIPDRSTSGEDLIELDPILPTSGPGGGPGSDPTPTPVPLEYTGAEESRAEDDRKGGPKGQGSGRNAKAGKILRYPLDEPGGPFEYDYISITAHDYLPSGLEVVGEKFTKAETAFKNLGPAYEKVIFPMQPQISETNAVNWSDDQLNPVQAILGKTANDLISNGITGGLKEIQNALGDLFSKTKNALGDSNTKAAVAAYFAGQAVGANLQGRMTGQVINPNLELLFNGPNLRTFNFNFRLTPRFKEESEIIREIIFAFKRNMSVQRSNTNLFLRSPRLFQLEYIYKGGDQHPYLNKFKPCAMTNFQVNYTPDGSYATFDETGSLTAYDLTMSFSEVMPIYSGDNEYTENPTDMGY